MAGLYPTVRSTATYAGANSNSHAVTMPAGVVSGDLLVMVCAIDSLIPVTVTLAGWTRIVNVPNSAQLDVYYKKSDGGEGATETVGFSANEALCAVTYRIDNMHDPDVQPPQASAGAKDGVGSVSPDPDELTPTIAGTGLWLAVHAHDGNLRTTTGFPSGYSGGVSTQIGTIGGTGVGTAQRENDPILAAEDPAVFTISASDQWSAATIFVLPIILPATTFAFKRGRGAASTSRRRASKRRHRP